MPNNELKQDLNDLMHKHLAAVVIWGGLILGGCLGWYTSTLMSISEATASNTEKSDNNEQALLRHLDQGNMIMGDVMEIREDVSFIKGKLEE